MTGRASGLRASRVRSLTGLCPTRRPNPGLHAVISSCCAWTGRAPRSAPRDALGERRTRQLNPGTTPERTSDRAAAGPRTNRRTARRHFHGGRRTGANPQWPIGPDDETSARIDETRELARRFLHAVVADPAILDGIPDGSTVVFLDANRDARETEQV